MTEMIELGYQNYLDAIPLLGRFLGNLCQYWWDDYSSIADYVDFYSDWCGEEELAEMRQECASLGAECVDDGVMEGFLRRMNANYPVSSVSGRTLLQEVGQRIEQLSDGAVPKAFDWTCCGIR